MANLSLKEETQDPESSESFPEDPSEVSSSSEASENESDQESEADSNSDGSSYDEQGSGDDRPEKVKPIQIWTPHVKKIGANAYGRRLNSRARNKSKAETKKGHRTRKQLTEVNLAVKGNSIW